jgi:hypothetical protein
MQPDHPFLPIIYPAMHSYKQGERGVTYITVCISFPPLAATGPKAYVPSTFSNKGNNAFNALALPSLLKMTAPALAVLR